MTQVLIQPADFSVAGKAITGVVIRDNVTPTGNYFASTGAFKMPPNSLALAVNFMVGGNPASIVLFNGMPLVGHLSAAQDSFSLAASFASDDVSVDVNLTGKHVNRPPHALFEPKGPFECNAFGGSNVVLHGGGSTDPDNDIATFFWNVDGGAATPGKDLATFLPLGNNDTWMTVIDAAGAPDSDFASLKVQDTTPPLLTATVSPTCLWPPNHSMILYQFGAGIDATATDICDPTPQITVIGVTSDQPPSGGGQGNQDPDVLFGAKGLCVRSERQGTDPAGRHYSVTLQAKDASGNATTKVVTITVAHDQAGSKCPNVDPGRVVGEGDPRCTAN